MKKLNCLILLCLGVFSITNAQVYPREFGKVSKEEMDMTECLFDKSAEAVVMFDLGKSYFVETDRSFDIIFERTTRIKILSDAGLKWADIEIPFYEEGGIYENVYEIEAYTYNLKNGLLQRTALDLKTCHDEKINQYWNQKKFAMPDVRAGSVIEFKYKIYSQYIFNLRDWEFQWRIPVVYSEYEVKLIPFYEYTWLFQGAKKFDVYSNYEDPNVVRHFGAADPYSTNNEYHDMVYKFGMKNLPGFSSEEYITTINDYIVKIDFQLSKFTRMDGTSSNIITTWPELIKDYLKDEKFGRYIKKSEGVASKVIDVKALSAKSAQEKFDDIVNYVKRNYNWNRSYAKYSSKSVNDFLREKVGNNADINLFMLGLFDAVGLDAFPVLISTRENGKIKYDYPYNHFFNWVIVGVKIGDKIQLTDATEVLLANDRIPIKCINDKGLVVAKDRVEWINLQSQFHSEEKTEFQIKFVDNSIKGIVSFSANEYDALYYRNNYGQDKKKIVEKWINDNYKVLDSSLIVKNYTEVKEPYIVSFEINNDAELINDKLYISPFLDEVVKDNPFKQMMRTYPVDFTYPQKRVYISEITIPDGYQIDYLPKESDFKNEFFEISYSIKSDEKKITASFTYFFKNALYQPELYQRIKFYFNDIIQKGNDKIVLIKK